MTIPAPTPTLIQSLQRGLHVIEVVTAEGPLTAKSISEQTGIVLPTAYHLLRTLIHEGYLCRLGDGRYGLGRQILSLTQLERRARSHRLIRDVMAELSVAAKASILVGVAGPADIVVRAVVGHPCTPRFDCWPGMSIPGHATAIGKSILLRMTPVELDAYVQQHPLRAYTSQTRVTLRRLRRDTARGAVAICDQEYMYGVSSVAAALDGTEDLAALGAVYSSNRSVRAREEVCDLLTEAAARISSVAPGVDVLTRSIVA